MYSMCTNNVHTTVCVMNEGVSCGECRYGEWERVGGRREEARTQLPAAG